MSRLEHRPLSTLLEYKTFEMFTKALVGSLDLAPATRLMAQIIAHESFDGPWFVCAYCTYASIDAATRFCRQIPQAHFFNPTSFAACADIRVFGDRQIDPANTQARTYRTLSALKQALGAINAAAQSQSYTAFVARVRVLTGQNSRSADRLAHAFERTLGHFALAKDTLGVADGDINAPYGPKAGCRALYSVGADARFEPTIAPQFEALAQTIGQRLNLRIGDVGIALSKWAMLCEGRYFIGHDIHTLRDLLPLFGRTALSDMMARAGFKKRLWAQPLDARRARGTFAREGVLINREFANHKVRLA